VITPSQARRVAELLCDVERLPVAVLGLLVVPPILGQYSELVIPISPSIGVFG
jgi:hypothetical protein